MGWFDEQRIRRAEAVRLFDQLANGLADYAARVRWRGFAVLTKHSLVHAGAVSSLRFILMVAVAWLWLGEHCGWREIAGMLCIGIGICLLKR
jgi:drug/metabolite transporter (DMT)-like permease